MASLGALFLATVSLANNVGIDPQLFALHCRECDNCRKVRDKFAEEIEAEAPEGLLDAIFETLPEAIEIDLRPSGGFLELN